MRSSVKCAAAMVALIALSSCANVGGTPSVGNAGATGTTTRATGTASTQSSTRTSTGASGSATDLTLDSGVTIEELKDDIDGAVEVVDGFWAKHWSDYYTGTYTPPTVAGLYDGTEPDTAPRCDGEPLEAYNAYYCPDGDFVAWDAGLLVNGADQIGDSWVYLVVAHEWGHAIQARLDSSLVAQAEELQADCLGAAALYGAHADGTLEFDASDEPELIGSLTALADQMPWTMSSDHGDAFQRVQWFTLGRNGGVNACHDVLVDPSASTAPTSFEMPPAATSVPPPPTG